MPYNRIDGSSIAVRPLRDRKSLLNIESIALSPPDRPSTAGPLAEKVADLAEKIIRARSCGASVMLAYGAHLIKNGGGPLLNALIEGGFVTHLATHGAGIIHDWEFAFQGASSESVREGAPVGRFGAWDETGRALNLAALAGAAAGIGLGEALGQFIAEDGVTLPSTDRLRCWISAAPEDSLSGARADLLRAMIDYKLSPGKVLVMHRFKKYSVPLTAYQHKVPFTVHPGIGYDIITNHPMFHGGAIGRTAATDARVFANSVMNLTKGVYISIGSAVMSPQVFEKAFSVANNLRRQRGLPLIDDHHIAVNDIADGYEWDWSRGEPPRDHPAYYLRFCKTFYRLGGEVNYLRGDNRVVIGNLVASLREKAGEHIV